jgi:hypothetical protein
MTGRPVVKPYTPLVAACSLKHHREGSKVAFSKWDAAEKKTRRFTGRVVSHVPSAHCITVAVEPSGRHHLIECGAVAAASP